MPTKSVTRILSIALNPTVDLSSEAEQVLPTQKTRTYHQVNHPGGGGVNVARVIATLGGEIDLLYMAGGATGALLTDSLKDIPINQHLVQIEQPTRVAYMVYERKTGLEFRFIPEGPTIAPAELEPVFDFVRKFDCDYIVASGGLPQGAPQDTYSKIASIAQQKGVRLILDCSGQTLIHTLNNSNVFLIKPNLAELEALVGKSLSKKEMKVAAHDLVQNNSAENVVVSLGADGVYFANANGGNHIPSPKVMARSAVGAGDSFVAALTFALASGKTVQEATLFGVAAGAAAVKTPGTGLCRYEDIMELYQALQQS